MTAKMVQAWIDKMPPADRETCEEIAAHIRAVVKTAVRWLTDREMWWLMHDSPTPIMTANDQAHPQPGAAVVERKTKEQNE
jgi:hypothetical protein